MKKTKTFQIRINSYEHKTDCNILKLFVFINGIKLCKKIINRRKIPFNVYVALLKQLKDIIL